MLTSMYLPTRTSTTSRKPSEARPCLTVIPWGSLTTGLGVTITRAITAVDLGERFGAQVAQMLGAAEHRSARMRPCVSEERIPAGVPMPKAWGQWAAWAPKLRRGSRGILFIDADLRVPLRGMRQTVVRAVEQLFLGGPRVPPLRQARPASTRVHLRHRELG